MDGKARRKEPLKKESRQSDAFSPGIEARQCQVPDLSPTRKLEIHMDVYRVYRDFGQSFMIFSVVSCKTNESRD